MSNAAIWNKDYARGSWNSLRSVRAVAHRAVMAGLAEHFGQDNDVLDVGCGEGGFSANTSRKDVSTRAWTLATLP